MATAAYRDWVKAGRPWKLAHPAAQYRYELWGAGWDVKDIGSIGNEEHLRHEYPQDHTPFSVTGWPVPNPYPYVHALDISHDPLRGKDVAALVAYWLAEARAGRTPWLKYIVFQRRSWSARSNWVERSAQGHDQHAHLSFRTDHHLSSIGTWPVTPQKGSPMNDKDREDFLYLIWRLEGIYHLREATIGPAGFGGESSELTAAIREIRAAVRILAGQPTGGGGQIDPVALATALAESDIFVDRLAAALAGHLDRQLTIADLGRVLRAAADVADGG